MPEPSGASQGLPVNRILQMRQQGFSDNQIVQTLQTDGYKSHQIFDAMNQADMRSAGEHPEQPHAQAPGTPPPTAAAPQPTQTTTPMAAPPPMTAPSPMPTSTTAGVDEEKIEEIAESIIEEKWEDLVKNVNKIIDWKEATESRIVKIEEDFKNLRSGFDTLHKGILGKVGEYEERMSGVSTELKALENVFKKILPTLAENVNELSRITTGMKKKKK